MDIKISTIWKEECRGVQEHSIHVDMRMALVLRLLALGLLLALLQAMLPVW